MKTKYVLVTALLLFAGVSSVSAGRLKVGFSGGNTHGNDLAAALGAANPNDTVFVATGLYIATDSAFLVPANVTLIGGYAKGDVDVVTRRYPGQFVPFTTADLSNPTEFTILDGNSYQRSLASQKHRVVKVENNGVVDGCLIRNGHIRNGNGGGVLLNGGKLYNSIVRGNVAMNHPDSAEALGGGVFIQGGGELINCLVAYNMANDGYGVAAGIGGGKMINNTITANTYSPVFAKIPATAVPFQMYSGASEVHFRPSNDIIPKYNAKITLSAFYISRILTTQGQFAVFCAAMDIPKSGDYGRLNVNILKGLTDPIKGSGTVGTRYLFPETDMQDLLRVTTGEGSCGLNYGDGVWHPINDTSTVEYPVGYITWHGALAYSVWLGGGLPTEAQWQFAARCNPDGTASDNLHSGAYGSSFAVSGSKNNDNDTATWRILDTIAWVNPTKSIDTATGKLGAPWSGRPHEVARKRPNAMGIYDMSGNAFEWCGDVNKNPPAYSSSSTATDPMDTGTGEHTVKGGGNNNNERYYFSIPVRFSSASSGSNIGLRPVVAF